MPLTTDFLPAREADLVVWSNTFNGLIVVDPTVYGLVVAQATVNTTLNTAFGTAYATANGDGTRTPAALIAKNAAKRALIANIRMLAGIIQKCPTVTDEQRSALGLTVPAARTPIPPPADAPGMDVVSVTAWTVKIRLHDATNPTRRGRPPGVSGAAVFSFVATDGAEPPTDIAGWKFEGNASRAGKMDVVFPNTVAPGTKVWLTAFWFNPRKQGGPACAPVGTNVQGGGVGTVAA